MLDDATALLFEVPDDELRCVRQFHASSGSWRCDVDAACVWPCRRAMPSSCLAILCLAAMTIRNLARLPLSYEQAVALKLGNRCLLSLARALFLRSCLCFVSIPRPVSALARRRPDGPGRGSWRLHPAPRRRAPFSFPFLSPQPLLTQLTPTHTAQASKDVCSVRQGRLYRPEHAQGWACE